MSDTDPAPIAEPVETIRCTDCGSPQDRYAAYEVRAPEEVVVEDGVKTYTFWLCRKCWDRMVGAAAFAITRGAF